MRVGISLSPGGLLLPYHLGVLDGLEYCGFCDNTSAIAGASAGAIAAASRACQIDSRKVLQATIDISDRTKAMGGARGRLLPLLNEKLQDFIDEDNFEASKQRPLAISYREIFPNYRSVHQTQFEHRDDLVKAVCHSSMFPFFSTNWPVTIDRTTTAATVANAKSRFVPRILVDGFFAVPRDRFGCPDFDLADGIDVDRTVTVSPFPKDFIGLNASPVENCITPSYEDAFQIDRLFRLATQSSSAEELTELYESGFKDAEQWFHKYGAYQPPAKESTDDDDEGVEATAGINDDVDSSGEGRRSLALN